MSKILLVEDDSNLREIYGARLEAEGYEIISASDGEEALALAVKERPNLIISDVMMPKISGFDMLDILRTTPETKDVKVIVMTALSQEEDRKRGEQLGADRYVVKSQVTLDDVVVMVQELLNGTNFQTAQTNTTTTIAGSQPQADNTTDAAASTNPSATDEPVNTPQANPTTDNLTAEDSSALDQEVQQFVATSPLMNGAVPPTNNGEASTNESAPIAQPPVNPNQTAS